MKKYVCQYSIIRFLPYVDAGEFANIGIVMTGINEPYFGYKLIHSNHHDRITGFFYQLNKDTFCETVKVLRDVFEGVKNKIEFQTPNISNYQDISKMFFENIVAKNETIVRYSETRVLITNDPVRELDKLYNRYVADT